MAEEDVQEEQFAEGDAAVGVLDEDDSEQVGLDSISDIPVEVSVVLGSSTMPVSQLLKLGRGAVIKLDRKVGEAVEIFVNNRLVARGEVVVVENRIGVTMTEIIKSEKE